MDINLYVRIRGRVHGPFGLEKLKAMVQRGQLSRIHQVSEDGNAWQKAGEYPDLFQQNSAPKAEPGSNQQSASAPAPTNQEQWYYEENRQPVGPVTEDELKSLINTGRIESQRRVWKEGMDDWTPANAFANLVSANSPININTHHDSDSRGDSDNHESSARSKRNDDVASTTMTLYQTTRPWVTFVSIMTFIYAGLWIVGGIYIMIIGSGTELSPLMMANGLTSMIMGGVCLTAGIFLLGYSSGLSRLRITKSTMTLNQSLASLNRFWTFIGIVLIVITVYSVFMGIYFFAFVGQLARELS